MTALILLYLAFGLLTGLTVFNTERKALVALLIGLFWPATFLLLLYDMISDLWLVMVRFFTEDPK
jgi:hypothetical protein